MITHGTPSDWFVWVFMLVVSLIAARLCYRQAKLVGAADGEVLDVLYAGWMFAFLVVGLVIFFHAPFHVG